MVRKKAKCGFCKSTIDVIIRGGIKDGFCEKCGKNIPSSNILDLEKERPNPNLKDGQSSFTIKMKK